MPDLGEQIRGLSPAALDIFKKQLPLKLKQLSGLERNTALEQLRQLPQLQGLPELSLGQQPAQPTPRQPVTPIQAPEIP